MTKACGLYILSLPLHCLDAAWDRDQPSLPFKTHKTINLTSMDHPILLGTPDTNIVNTGLDLTSRISTKPEAAKEPITRPVSNPGLLKVRFVFVPLKRF